LPRQRRLPPAELGKNPSFRILNHQWNYSRLRIQIGYACHLESREATLIESQTAVMLQTQRAAAANAAGSINQTTSNYRDTYISKRYFSAIATI